MQFGAIEAFQGLKFETDVSAGGSIAAIIGRNGAGKSRLLQAISEGKVEVLLDGAVVTRDATRLLRLNEFQPNLNAGYDPIQQRERRSQAVALYNAYKGKFNLHPLLSVQAIGNPQHLPGRNVQIDIPQLAQVVSTASRELGRDPNDLANDDISDYLSGSGFSGMGTLNVTGVVRAYWDRLEDNNVSEYRNAVHGEDRPHWKPQQFVERFGPPPWEALNEFLTDIFDGRYFFETPTRATIDAYDGRLYRTKDKLVVEPAWLSSGEKVLMWLCLSMFASNSARSPAPPKLLLLDEPDGALHPEMVQKLHKVLRNIADRFGSGILFTTHSPTTIALFSGPVWRISEDSLVEVDKDAAIGELLVGLDQVVVHYARRRQVYVESHKDEEVYSELFTYLQLWNLGTSEHIALSFVPAAPKLAEQNVRDQISAHLGQLDQQRIEAFLKALNGQGDCAKVIGAVESLDVEDGVPVCGIIDWDGNNMPHRHIYVLGAGLFDNIESAILNPLTLGLYLLQNFAERLDPGDYGLDPGFDVHALVSDVQRWQGIAQGVMRRVLGDSQLQCDLECAFVKGGSVYLDKRYAYMDGHALERIVTGDAAYPFLNAVRKPSLLMDVVRRGIRASGGRTFPRAVSDLFIAIQTAG